MSLQFVQWPILHPDHIGFREESAERQTSPSAIHALSKASRSASIVELRGDSRVHREATLAVVVGGNPYP